MTEPDDTRTARLSGIDMQRVERLRQMLFHGGHVVDDDGTKMPDHPATQMVIAQLVHQADVIAWDAGGQQGPKPTLAALLRKVRYQGQYLSVATWMGALPQDEHAEEVREQLRREMAEESEARVLPLGDHQALYKFTPRDVVSLRHQIIDWLGRQGIEYYSVAINNGKQSVFSHRRGMSPARGLVVSEAEGLRDAALYYVDDEMCELLARAYPTMPAFAPVPSDLPTSHGFAVFASPIADHVNVAFPMDEVTLLNPADGDSVDLGRVRERTAILGVMWRPATPEQMPDGPRWAAGGLWLTFYAIPSIHHAVSQHRTGMLAEIMREQAKHTPRLTPENEMILAWYPADGRPETDWLLTDQNGIGRWAKAVLATFQLARQANLAQTDVQRIKGQPLSKAAKRRGDKPRPDGDVRVVRLRFQAAAARTATPDDATGTGASRTYRHRFTVGFPDGFWRNTWYPKSQHHRPQWIAPYLKGPEGAPLLNSERVSVVAPPKKK